MIRICLILLMSAGMLACPYACMAAAFIQGNAAVAASTCRCQKCAAEQPASGEGNSRQVPQDDDCGGCACDEAIKASAEISLPDVSPSAFLWVGIATDRPQTRIAASAQDALDTRCLVRTSGRALRVMMDSFLF